MQTLQGSACHASRRTKLSSAPRSSTAPTPPTSRRCRRSTSSNPGSVSDEWRLFFQSLHEEPRHAATAMSRTAPSWGDAARRSCTTQRRAGRGADRRLRRRRARDPRQARRRAPRPAASSCRRPPRCRATQDSLRALMLIRAYRVMGHLVADLDPLGHRRAQGAPGAAARDLRLHRGRSRPADLHRQGAGPRDGDHPPDPADPAPHLLPPHRRRVHAHHQPGAEALDPGAHRGRGEGHPLHASRARRRSSTS